MIFPMKEDPSTLVKLVKYTRVKHSLGPLVTLIYKPVQLIPTVIFNDSLQLYVSHME
jgi:hypothetical protein